MAVIKDGVLMKVEESDMIDGVYIIPEEVKKISEQAFSEDYTEQKQEDTWMIVRKEKKTDKIKNFIKRMFHRTWFLGKYSVKWNKLKIYVKKIERRN